MKNSFPVSNHSPKEDATIKKKTNGVAKSKAVIAEKNGHQGIELDFDESRELLTVLTEVKNGNFGVRVPIDKSGIHGKIYDTLNQIIDLNEEMMLEFTRAGNTIGKQGKLTQRIEVPNVKGSWSNRCGIIECTYFRSRASHH